MARASQFLKLAAIAAVIIAALALAPAAGATTLRTPANGSTIKTGASVLFDWTWASDEIGSELLFAQSPDPSPANWSNPKNFETTMIVTNSEVKIVPSKSLTPGVWYWRTCSRTQTTADDTCVLGPEIWSFTLAPPLSISEARAATKAKVIARYHPKFLKVSGCQFFDVNKYDCSGRFRTSKRKCTFASFVDNTGAQLAVKVYAVRCKRR